MFKNASLLRRYHKETGLSESIPWLIQIVHSKIFFIDTILFFFSGENVACLDKFNQVVIHYFGRAQYYHL